MYFCALLNSVVWVCFYLHRCVCCYAMALVLFLTSFYWTLCLQGTTAVSPVQLVRTSDGFSLSLWVPAHWTHPCSKDGHIGGLPSRCHTFSNTLTQAECWVTICNMRKTDIFTSVVQQNWWPRSYVVCALTFDTKTKSFGLCFPEKERLEVHSTGAITRDVLIDLRPSQPHSSQVKEEGGKGKKVCPFRRSSQIPHLFYLCFIGHS